MNSTNSRPLALIILDGWGNSPGSEGNAVALAHTPNYDEICSRYPQTLLAAAGERVGLSPSTPGSAESGHLNIGAGRVVQTDIARIARAVKTGALGRHTVLTSTSPRASAPDQPVHLIGR